MLDECVMPVRCLDMEDGRMWTGVGEEDKGDDKGETFDDSYRGEDYEEWETRQQERDESITLSLSTNEGPDIVLQWLHEIWQWNSEKNDSGTGRVVVVLRFAVQLD